MKDSAMTVERLLAFLAICGVTLLMVAIAIASGNGGWPFATTAEMSEAAAGASRWKSSDVATLVWGLVIGWCLRWLYGLPWATVPRAIVAWLVGCGSGAAMTGLAICCTAILLFY